MPGLKVQAPLIQIAELRKVGVGDGNDLLSRPVPARMLSRRRDVTIGAEKGIRGLRDGLGNGQNAYLP
jgi:hypothetical protein